MLAHLFCANAVASRLREGLGSLFIAEASRSHATLEDGTVVAFKSDWPDVIEAALVVK